MKTKNLDLALKHRLPTISDLAGFATRGGGLMSYGFNMREAVRSGRRHRLRGAKAGEIPIQQATTFRFVINMKTAKALDLTIPPSLLLRRAR